MKLLSILTMAAIFFVACDSKKGSIGEMKERSDIDAKYKWDLTHLYKTMDDFEKEKKFVEDGALKFKAFKGKLSEQKTIKEALDLLFDLRHKVQRLEGYAMMLNDQDMRKTEGAGLKSTIEKLASELSASSAFVAPELLGLPESELKALGQNKAMSDYDMYFRDLIRQKKHVLSEKEEALLAQAGVTREAGYNIYSTFYNGELTFPEIETSEGKVILSSSVYVKLRQSSNREDRQKVFTAFFDRLGDYKNTFAKMLATQVDTNIFYATTSKYDSVLQSSLYGNDIPVSFYSTLIDTVKEGLPVLHRYLKLKKKVLGIKDDMRYYDLYPSVAGSVEYEFTPEKGNELIANALKPLGAEYVKVASEALKPGSGWTDVYPNKGKRSGAYMTGGHYDVHPFMLLNFQGSYDSISTTAHELGHAMHSYYSNGNQPFTKAHYATFTAEIASIFNENLLFEYMLNEEDDDDKKIALLGESLESLRTTVFRQTSFAEFENLMYKAAEAKKPLTSDFLNATYLNILKTYYGHDKGIVKIDDRFQAEWAYIPHFYYEYYVYQYVTGYLASLVLSERVFKGDTKTRDSYLTNFLKKGASKYPLEILKDVGIDMTEKEVYREAFKIFESRLEQLEKLL